MSSQVAAVIIEPVLGEGGFLPAPPEFMEGLRAICDEHGICLIADEVQTGFARTGELFALDHEGVVPDLIVTAKGIAGGLPLAGLTGRAELMDSCHTGGLGGTFGGNPVACAASLATIELLRESLIANAADVGSYTFVYAKGYSYLTNDPAACANCHIMSEHFAAWTKSSHRAVAVCND